MERVTTLIAMTALTMSALISGCASTPDRAREVAAADMRCQPENVMVSLDSRPMLGVTRYAAEGCNKQRMYVCQKTVFFYGLPISSAQCEREKT